MSYLIGLVLLGWVGIVLYLIIGACVALGDAIYFGVDYDRDVMYAWPLFVLAYILNPFFRK